MSDDLPVIAFESPAAWEAWLEENHAEAGGLWVKFAKKGSGIDSVNHAEALDGAICFGWIDGQTRRVEGDSSRGAEPGAPARAEHRSPFYLQRFTPRRSRSRWSQVNCAKAEALIAAGRMRPAGLAEIERAKEDGRWEAAYAPPSTATVPDDLQAALDADPAAAEFFAGLSGQNRYAILYRIQEAKRPETRRRRIEKFVAMLAAGETLH